MSTLASQSHLGKRSRKYLQLCLGPKCCYVCRSMSKKRPPGHFRGPSLKLPVPGSLSHVATSLCRDCVQIDQNQFSLISIVRACSYPAHVHRRLLFEDLCKKNLPAVSSSLQSEELALVSVATECFQFCFLLKLAATIISIFSAFTGITCSFVLRLNLARLGKTNISSRRVSTTKRRSRHILFSSRIGSQIRLQSQNPMSGSSTYLNALLSKRGDTCKFCFLTITGSYEVS